MRSVSVCSSVCLTAAFVYVAAGDSECRTIPGAVCTVTAFKQRTLSMGSCPIFAVGSEL